MTIEGPNLLSHAQLSPPTGSACPLLAQRPSYSIVRRSSLRLGLVGWAFLSLALSLNGDSIGVSVNGTCEAGSCPATPLPYNSSYALPVDFTLTLADGDIYLINGSFTSTINADGSDFHLDYPFQITYEGNATGGASAADSITVLAYFAWQAAFGTASAYSNLIGAFGPTIAASSSASDCVNGAQCLGPAGPPGSFDLRNSFTLTSTDGAFDWDFAITSDFGAGSPVGSYIVFAQTEPIPPTTTPEPASLGVLALGLLGIGACRVRRTQPRTDR